MLFTLAAALQAAFAQKTENPELRNEHAANPTRAQSTKSKSVTTRPLRSNATSAGELAKIERGGTRKTGTHRPSRIAKPAPPPSQTGAAAQSKNKPAKFSYHPPKAGSKGTGNGGRTAASSRPPKSLR